MGEIAEQPLRSAVGAARLTLRGELPRRYAEWLVPFESAARGAFREGMEILDVGAGRHPTFPDRSSLALPAGTRYVGFDALAAELAAAPPGRYHEAVTGDVTVHEPVLDDRFDLIVSWWLLEHVQPLSDALAHLHGYLRPGGRFVAMLSGGLSPFSFAKRVIPEPLVVWLATRFADQRDTDDVFPARFDHCTYWSLRELGMATGWETFLVRPFYNGASYLAFSRHLQAAYVGFEELMISLRRPNLASHYLVVGTRAASPAAVADG